MNLRPAISTDAGSVGAILSEFIDETEWMPRIHTRAQDIGFAGDMIARNWVIVATRDGEIDGFCARDGDEIHALYVRRCARGAGIGTALLRDARHGRGRLALWSFQANDAARRFYASHGFSEVRTTDGAGNDERLPDVRLIWCRKES